LHLIALSSVLDLMGTVVDLTPRLRAVRRRHPLPQASALLSISAASFRLAFLPVFIMHAALSELEAIYSGDG
jgi:hypothetical protein